MQIQRSLEALKKLDSEIKTLENVTAVLAWDQQTYMPMNAIADRSDQLSAIQGLVHEKSASEEIGDLLGQLGSTEELPEGEPSLDHISRAMVKAWRRRYDRSVKIPDDLVVRFAKLTSLAQSSWIEARQNDDFKAFSPHLKSVLDLSKERAEAIGYVDSPYDPLLDEFEPWMKSKEVKSIFDGLLPRLKSIVDRIGQSEQVDDSFLLRSYPVDAQERFGLKVLKDIGYEFDRGRLDISAHPFTTTLGGSDVRLTTRYNKDFFKTGIFGIIHECGHGLYELGFAQNLRGSILADGTSLGIHESQSRTWENVIGRSYAFWEHYLPLLKKEFPTQLDGVDVRTFYRAINKVEPTLIRVEADEVTYGMHIILRFNLEMALLSGDLVVDDLPTAWNDEMARLLGIVPGNDADGVLQDIHWSHGLFGYFPTYALGNLYGAQFSQVMKSDIREFDDNIRNGDFGAILNWMRENIHSHGASASADEICQNVTGESLNPDPFVAYLEDKYSSIYGI